MKKTLIVMIAGLAATLFATGSIAAEKMEVDIHGFISQGYLSGDDTDFAADSIDDSFLFNEMGINFGKELNENLRFGIQFFARDFIEMSSNEVKIDWAYADYRFSELLGMKFGQIKFPHGFYNETRDIDMLRNPIFLPESVYQEVSHDLYINDVFLSLQGISSRDLYLSLQGIGVYGYLDFSLFGGLTYQAMFGTQGLETDSRISNRQLEYFKGMAPDLVISDSALENESVDVDFKYAGSVLWDTPIDGLRLGATLNNIKMSVVTRFAEAVEFIPTEELMEKYNLPSDDPIPVAVAGEVATVDYKKLLNTVFSVEYNWENLILTVEFMLTEKEYKMDAFDAIEVIGNAVGDEEIANFGDVEETNTSTAWYVGGAYRLMDWMELGGYYSQSRFEEPESSLDFPINFFTKFDDICATIRFDLNEYWTIKVEAHRFRGVYPSFESITDEDMDEAEENWYMYAAKMTVAF